MAAFDGANSVQKGALDTAKLVPEIWSDEIIAAYKSNLVVAGAIRNMSVTGKKGDAIQLPVLTRGVASAKAAGTAVTLQIAAGTGKSVTLDKHYEYSRLLEDFAAIQAQATMRGFYTDDAGFALAKQVDQDLFVKAALLQGGSGTAGAGFANAKAGGDGSTAFTTAGTGDTTTATALTDAGIRKMAQTLDDQDVPLSERCIILPPVEKKNLLGIARFTEQAFVGSGDTIRNGQIGEIYGMPVLVSTNCPYIWIDATDGQTDYYVSFSSTQPASGADVFGHPFASIGSFTAAANARIGMMLHKDSLVLATQMNVRVQSQYKQEYLADLLTADTIYGTGEYRDEGGVVFAVPA